MIDVVALGPDDWQLWRELRLTALADAPAAFGATLSDWSGSRDTEQRWRARLASVAFNAAATLNGAPAGMVSATAPDNDRAVELISMWVAPSVRGLGIGDALISAVLSWADAANATAFLLVREHNHPAIALYQRHGFVDTGQVSGQSGERLFRHGR